MQVFPQSGPRLGLLLALVFAQVLPAQWPSGFFRKDIRVSGDCLAFGDFNGDGKPDLVVGRQKSLSVLLNTGNGSFGKPVMSELIPGARSLSTADFNGDGNSDVIVTLSDGLGIVEVWLGRGDGTFLRPKKPESTLGVGVSADFNSDGLPDLVSTYWGSHSVSLGNGDGTFREVANFFTGAGGVPVVADFNQDGNADLGYTVPSPESVAVSLGRGDGTFQPAILSTLPAFSTLLITADLNGDGVPDLVTETATALGKGDGSFTAFVRFFFARAA